MGRGIPRREGFTVLDGAVRGVSGRSKSIQRAGPDRASVMPRVQQKNGVLGLYTGGGEVQSPITRGPSASGGTTWPLAPCPY